MGGARRLSLLLAICGIPRTERSDKEAVKHLTRREVVDFGEVLECFGVGLLVQRGSVIILSLIHSVLADSTDPPCTNEHQA